MKIAVQALLLLVFTSCSGGGSSENAGGVSFFTGLSISETDANIRKWSLKTPVASMHDSSGRMVFSAPVLQLYEENKLATVITAQTGSLDMPGKSAVLTTDVLVNAKKDDMLLKTQKLYYSSSKGKIWTDEKVTLFRGKTEIRGKGFTANPDLSEIEIEHQETKINGE